MRVLVPKKSLADALAKVERIVPNRSSNPGLSLLRIDVQDDALVLSGSNMDVDIRSRLAADVRGNGSFAVTAHVFGQIVRALPGDDVAMELSENEMQISSGNYTTKLQLVAPGSAPVLSFPDSHSGSIDARLLIRVHGSAVGHRCCRYDCQENSERVQSPERRAEVWSCSCQTRSASRSRKAPWQRRLPAARVRSVRKHER